MTSSVAGLGGAGGARFPLGPFVSWEDNPVLSPGESATGVPGESAGERLGGHSWESANVYNPAAIVVDGMVTLLYRAHSHDKVSRIGLARSEDGLHFTREPDPVVVPEHDYEQQGCEDPRISLVEGTFYLTYTGYSGSSAQLCLATSHDLRTWVKHGPLFPGFNTWGALPYGPTGPWSKAGVIWPERLDGVYHMWFGEGAIYHATSTDLLTWEPDPQDAPMLSPRPGHFDATLVEIGAPPVATDNGLLVFLTNGAVAQSRTEVDYRCGQFAVAKSHPEQALAIMEQPWLSPSTDADRNGMVANVTFVEGLVWHRDRWLAYYGQADTHIGVAIFNPHLRQKSNSTPYPAE